jgi:putative transposase
MKAGKYYVSVLCEVENKNHDKIASGEGIGIDLGVKDFAILSDGRIFRNINKTEMIRKIEKKLKREQRSLSRNMDI